ncbi:MAG TPA: hypothetical protein VMV79_08075 [Alphaproteobacteria bacterium]|nr:hypothetical protein [Alphaproteobacteria bacterium]
MDGEVRQPSKLSGELKDLLSVRTDGVSIGRLVFKIRLPSRDTEEASGVRQRFKFLARLWAAPSRERLELEDWYSRRYRAHEKEEFESSVRLAYEEQGGSPDEFLLLNATEEDIRSLAQKRFIEWIDLASNRPEPERKTQKPRVWPLRFGLGK